MKKTAAEMAPSTNYIVRRRPHLSFLSPRPWFQNRYAHLPLTISPQHPQRVNICTRSCAKLSQTDPPPQYVPLHVHSDFSLLDGASQLPSLVARAAELGVPALALTDHGVLYGAVQLVRTCERFGVKPIIGNEMYLVNDPLDGEEPVDPKLYKAPKRYHLIVLAKNTVGYRNLVKLTTMAHLDGKVGRGIFARPCINKAQLFAHREGLIVSSACLGGEIPQALLNNDLEAARDVATWYRDVFGDDFYLEIQDHGSDEDRKVNPHMIRLSRELGIKAIATNDSHFTSCLDAEAHDALICIQTGKMLSDENRLHYAGNEFFKSVDEMRECFVDHLPRDAIDEALLNTLGVAEKVEKYDLFGETRIPDFPIPKDFDGSLDAYLAHVARESLSERLRARQKAGLADPDAEQQYYDRLDFEVNMIQKMGFSSYFLVVWDYVRHAKQLNIPVGPGRGSAAGSLVAFALRITDVDPIPFNLLFERFLNPERKSMPDIDTDFSVKGREEIISYVSKRYGRDRVAQIITFNRLTSKAVLKDVARVHAVPYAEADRLAKLIPVVRGKPATLTKMLSNDTPSLDFKKQIEKNPPYKVWIDKAMRIEGTNKTYGIHAAGVVISASPLTDIVPLSRAKHGEIITQYAMEDVESLGLLKMDFLGLKNLTVIESTLEFINEGRRQLGIEKALDFSVDALPLDDENTYKLLSEGELDGIFQLDASAGMRNVVRELRPSSLEDISSILALYRPGPLDAGLIPKFINRKHGREAIEYDHPLLEPILKETYGIMVYQEQIMRIARDLAGYSLGQADILRRAMGKKKTADMEREKPRFIKGAMQNGVSEEKATYLFDMMIKFAEYCFNKSHSTAYAYLTYQTAYLKANYPVEYSAALLRSNMNQSDKLVRYLADAHVSGVRVAPPAVNESDLGFTVDRTKSSEGVVLFGLEAVKTVGGSVSGALLEERIARGPFLNIIDLIERVNLRVLNKRAMGALIQAGAFDKLHPNRKVLLEQLDKLLALRRKLRDRKKRRENKNLSLEQQQTAADADALEWEQMEVQLQKDSIELPDFSQLERLAGEKATLGFYASGHPLYDMQLITETLGCTKVGNVVGDVSEIDGSEGEDGASVESKALPDGSDVMILSCVTEFKKITTAKGKKMAKWMIEDASARVPGIVFPGSYDLIEQIREKPIGLGSDLLGSSESLQTEPNVGSENEASSYVVEEDARVVVWGRIDMESSGTAQVIIDDVQRIEDVKYVVVTAPYKPENTPRFYREILREMASRVLELDISHGANGIRVYRDANGNIRRRRERAIPLSKKFRIPLVLRCLDEREIVSSYSNAGNDLRFPADCEELLESLQDMTGFKVELVSMSETLSAAAESEDENGQNPCEHDHTKEVGHASERKDTDNHVIHDGKNQDLGATPASRTDFEEFQGKPQNAEEPDDTLRIESEGQEVDDEHEDQHTLCSESEIQESKGEQDDQSVVMVHGVQMTMEEKLEFKQSKQSMKLKPHFLGMNKLEANLAASLRLRSRRSKESAKIESNHVASYGDIGESQNMRVAVVTPGRTPSSADVAVQSRQTNSETFGTVPSSHFASTDEQVVPHPQRNPSSPRRTKLEEISSSFEPYNNPGDVIVENSCNGSEAKSDARLGTETESVSREFMDLVETANDLEPSPIRVEDAIVELLDAKPVVLPTEMVIRFEGGQMGAVLDAIALVGGGAIRATCDTPLNVSAITTLDMSRATEEDLTLRVSGRMAYVDKLLSFVLVDVKEVKPSGTRKRIRSFGPVVCICATGQVGTALAMTTKKAKKDLESVKKRVLIAAAAISTEVQRATGKSAKLDVSGAKEARSKTFSSAESALDAIEVNGKDLDGASLCDGGNLLLLMSRSAQVCVDKCLLTTNSKVITLDGFFVENPQLLGTASSIEVQTHLEGTLLGVAKVQAVATVKTLRGQSTACFASFRVSNSDLKGGNTSSIAVDEDPLFHWDETAGKLKEYSQGL